MALACKLCAQPFDTRNALFRHLLDLNTECGAFCASKGMKSTATTRGRKIALLFGYHGVSSDAAVAAIWGAITGSTEPPDGLTAASSWIASNNRALAQEPEVAAVADVMTFNMLRGSLSDVNARLPRGVRVLGHMEVGVDFHAERMARRRRYDYLLPLSLLCGAADAGSSSSTQSSDQRQQSAAAAECGEGDVAAVMQRIKPLLRRFYGGTDQRGRRVCCHNFCASTAPTEPIATRRLFRFKHTDSAALRGRACVVLSVTCNAFLSQQARRMVGLLIACARGALPPDAIDAALDAQYTEHMAVAPAAPACGVHLAEVGYSPAHSDKFGLSPPQQQEQQSQQSPQQSQQLQQQQPQQSQQQQEEGGSGDKRGGAAGSEVVWGKTVTAAALQQWRQEVLEAAAARWEEEEHWGSKWVDGPLQESLPALRAFMQRWRDSKQLAQSGPPQPPLSLSPAEAAALPPATEVYARVLRLLREADASGLWPDSSKGRQTVIANGAAAAVGEEDESEEQVPAEAAAVELLVPAQLATSGPGDATVAAGISTAAPPAATATAAAAGWMAAAAAAAAAAASGEAAAAAGAAAAAARAGGSFSVGRMPATCAVPRGNDLFPELMRAAFELERVLMPNRTPSSTIAINRHAQFRPHKDSGAGSGQSLSLIVGLGDYAGGELVVEGVECDIRYRPLEFNGWTQRHWTLPFRGERYSLVWFTPKGCEDLGESYSTCDAAGTQE